MHVNLELDPRQLSAWIASNSISSHPYLIVDSHFAAAVASDLPDSVRGMHSHVVLRDWPEISTARSISIDLARSSCDQVISIGGGSTADLAKIAVSLGDETLDRVLARDSRWGAVLMPISMNLRIPLTVATTTLGPSSESSYVACYRAGSRRLAAGSGLLPARSVVLTASLATLSQRQLVLGALEVVLRILCPAFANFWGEQPRPDEVARRIGLASEAVVHASALSQSYDQGAAEAIAQIGSESHFRPPAETGSSPYNYRLWYLATALSESAGITKMEAMVACWPSYVRSVRHTGSWLGTAKVEGRAAIALDSAIASIDALVTSYADGARLASTSPQDVARLCWRRWSAGAPTLTG